jgi:hypothetical protein
MLNEQAAEILVWAGLIVSGLGIIASGYLVHKSVGLFGPRKDRDE